MPFGAPAYTVPKSGCIPVSAPHDAMRLSDRASRGEPEMSVRHAFDAGKIGLPPRSPLPFPSAVKVTEAPAIEAVTEVARKVPSRVHLAEACPLASVVLNAALSAPLPGAADHVTTTPLTGAPAALVTVTTSGAASVDDKVPCCASPLVLAITFACAPVPPDVSVPGVVGAAAAHDTAAENSRSSSTIFEECMRGRRCARVRRARCMRRQSFPSNDDALDFSATAESPMRRSTPLYVPPPD